MGPNSFRTPSIQRPLCKGLSEIIRCSRPLLTDSTAFHVISNFSPYLENITPRFSPVEGTSSLFKVSKGRRWAENKFGLVCSFRKGFSMTNFWNDATRRVIRKSISLSENQWRWWDSHVSCQARGCPACVPLPSERGRLPQRPRQNPLPLSPRTIGRRPEGAPAFQGWGIQRPGGWKLKYITHLT